MKDLAHLIAGVLLGLAACVLVAIHTPVPAFIPYAALTLIGVAGGLALPWTVTPAPAAPAAPVAQLPATAAANVQAANPPVTPTVLAAAPQRPAEPPAPAA